MFVVARAWNEMNDPMLPVTVAPAGMAAVMEKTIDGARVTIWRDASQAFYVGKAPDANLERYPMGAFRSVDAARAWADRSFPGGEWWAGSRG